jgi:hypothetical protein
MSRDNSRLVGRFVLANRWQQLVGEIIQKKYSARRLRREGSHHRALLVRKYVVSNVARFSIAKKKFRRINLPSHVVECKNAL